MYNFNAAEKFKPMIKFIKFEKQISATRAVSPIANRHAVASVKKLSYANKNSSIKDLQF